MKLLVVTYGSKDHASSRTRAIQYFDVFFKNNFEINHIPLRPFLKKGSFFYLYRFVFKRLKKIQLFLTLLFKNNELIFSNRYAFNSLELFIIKLRKINLIFDFDDAIYLGSNKKLKQVTNTVLYAKSVIVSTPFLKEFCSQKGVNPIVIPTSVDDKIFFPSNNIEEIKKNKTIVIGWMGSPSTSKYLFKIKNTLIRLQNEFDIKFIFIGVGEHFKIDGLVFENSTWYLEKEAEYLRKFDIGIMPLIDDQWEKNKGGYKLYLYFASGIPAVASSVGINSSIIIENKNGFIADNEQDWYEKLKFLILNEKERKAMGEFAYSDFLAKYSKSKCANELIHVFKNIKD
jgi:glycosyltransferase involved in cell wall biosynthesis